MANKQIPVFAFFRCKRIYHNNHLSRLPYKQRNDIIEEEMLSAFTRLWAHTEEERDFYGYTASEDKQDLIFVDWMSSTTGALTRWFRKRFKEIKFEGETFITTLTLFDVIDLCNACAKASRETGGAYFYGVDDLDGKKFFPAQHCGDDGELYGTDYCEELDAALRHMIKILRKTDFGEELIYVIVKMREYEPDF